ncbi:hypothetical protein FOCC_FOCC014496, partial [Frankliniella occidentalis]
AGGPPPPRAHQCYQCGTKAERGTVRTCTWHNKRHREHTIPGLLQRSYISRRQIPRQHSQRKHVEDSDCGFVRGGLRPDAGGPAPGRRRTPWRTGWTGRPGRPWRSRWS